MLLYFQYLQHYLFQIGMLIFLMHPFLRRLCNYGFHRGIFQDHYLLNELNIKDNLMLKSEKEEQLDFLLNFFILISYKKFLLLGSFV